MKRKAVLWAAAAVAVLALLQLGCKPIGYYLEQVYKVCGTVTDARSGEPLQSVEVSLDPYRYSELTNGLGDYELEMAAGTWTLAFSKEGYEVHAEPVTVGVASPRIVLDVALQPIGPIIPPPEEWELEGAWLSLREDEEPGRLEFSADTLVMYEMPEDTEPWEVCALTVTQDWTTEDEHWFHGEVQMEEFGLVYFVFRISGEGADLTAGGSTDDYPAVLDHEHSELYGNWYRPD